MTRMPSKGPAMAVLRLGLATITEIACGAPPCQTEAAEPRSAMPPKRNPLNLNPLQLRTLTLLQVLARIPNVGQQRPDGSVAITQFPNAHGDHFHLGDAVVSGKDATGLYNESVWNALTRKGVAKADYP